MIMEDAGSQEEEKRHEKPQVAKDLASLLERGHKGASYI